jgi:HlyD family secretion protein
MNKMNTTNTTNATNATNGTRAPDTMKTARPRKSNRWMFIIVVVVLAGISIWRLPSSSPKAAVDVSLGKIETVDLLRTVSASGIIKAGDQESIAVSSTRRVISVHAKEGDQVKKGQLLAEIDVQDLTLQRQKLVVQGQQLEANLKELLSPTLNAGKTAVNTRVEQLQLDVADARRKLADAQTLLDKNHTLFDAGALSLQALDASKTAVTDLTDQVKRIEASLISAKSDAGDLSASSKQQIENVKRQQEQNSFDIALIDNQLDENHITASLDGLLVSFPIREGRFPQQGDIVRIQDTKQVEVIVRLPQEDVVQLKMDQTARFSLKGVQEPFAATVKKIGKEALVEGGSGSRTPKVEVTLVPDNSSALLVPGYDADVVIDTGKEPNTVAVKREAVMKDKKGNTVVYVVESAAKGNSGDTTGTSGGAAANEVNVEGTVKIVPVTVGLEDDMNVGIKSDLPVGTIIVLAPSASLKSGTLVKGSVSP